MIQSLASCVLLHVFIVRYNLNDSVPNLLTNMVAR